MHDAEPPRADSEPSRKKVRPVAHPGVAPSMACGSNVAMPVDGYQDIQVGGEARRFIVHFPPSYGGKEPFPRSSPSTARETTRTSSTR